MRSKLTDFIYCCLLLIISCSKPPNTTPSYYALIGNIYEDGDWIVTEWNGFKWLVLPSKEYKLDVLITSPCKEREQKDIYDKLIKDPGQPLLIRKHIVKVMSRRVTTQPFFLCLMTAR